MTISAKADGAALVVFPELSLTGYYPADLLDEPDFLARVDTGLDRLLSLTRSTPGLHWVVGAPCRREGPGKPLHNCLLVLADGVIIEEGSPQEVFTNPRHERCRSFLSKIL